MNKTSRIDLKSRLNVCFYKLLPFDNKILIYGKFKL